jgi:hypothetical protein
VLRGSDTCNRLVSKYNKVVCWSLCETYSELAVLLRSTSPAFLHLPLFYISRCVSVATNNGVSAGYFWNCDKNAVGLFS